MGFSFLDCGFIHGQKIKQSRICCNHTGKYSCDPITPVICQLGFCLIHNSVLKVTITKVSNTVLLYHWFQIYVPVQGQKHWT